MAQLGFYFDSVRCVGCKTCQIVCKEKNGLAIGELYRKVSDYETGEFPTPGYYHLSSTCNHCAEPACMAACPSGAITKGDDGVVSIDKSVCVGSRTCFSSCPYMVPQWLEEQGVSGKCDFCKDLLELGENPVCVDACPQHALVYGDIDELKATYPDAVVDLPILPDSTMTTPSTIINPRPAMLENNFTQKYL